MSFRLRLLQLAETIPLEHLPPYMAIALSSWGRRLLWQLLQKELPAEEFHPPATLRRTCWGIRFRSPLFNAAGLFKYGEGYQLAYRQGAGAYLVGTSTALPRRGRSWRGIRHPFARYRRSAAALNALGLPNPGHHRLARLVEKLPRYPDFPIGASVALDPELPPQEALPRLLEGLQLYAAAGVDFLELNESCPNVPHEASWQALTFRLRWIAEHFLARRTRRLPVVVKISVDTPATLLPLLLDLLQELGYDGITIGNTSTAYEALLSAIAPEERRAYSYFWRHIGGGVSGAPLAERRRQLLRIATQWRNRSRSEFHIIAVGGIGSPDDLSQALNEGASLAQWYTGYFFALPEHGNAVYRWMYSRLALDP